MAALPGDAVGMKTPPEARSDVAKSRGVDLIALLNWVMVEYRPLLLLRRAEHGVAMLRAAATELPQRLAAAVDPRESLNKVNELIDQLLEVASKLSKQVDDQPRRAA